MSDKYIQNKDFIAFVISKHYNYNIMVVSDINNFYDTLYCKFYYTNSLGCNIYTFYYKKDNLPILSLKYEDVLTYIKKYRIKKLKNIIKL